MTLKNRLIIMSNAAIEARLDKLLERVSGGAHQPVVDPNREVARMVKRTEVATTSQKQSVVKFIVIGVVIILLLVGMIYFVAKTKYGKGIRDVIGEYLPFGSKKRKAQDDMATQGPKKVLVTEEVDLRSRPRPGPPMPPRLPPTGQAGRPPSAPPVTIRVPPIKPKDDNEHLDPGAVPFRRRRAPQSPPGPPPGPRPGQVTENDDAPPPPSQRTRGPSPPVEDNGPPPPPELVDASRYQND